MSESTASAALGPVAAVCGDRMDQVEGAYLDCVSDVLALLLAAQGVADVRSPFACDWRFDLVDAPASGDVVAGLTGLDLPPRDLDDKLALRTGWRPRWRPMLDLSAAVDDWHRTLAAGQPLVVVGDAYALPWLPYAGHEHMEHGFVVEGLRPDGKAGPQEVWLDILDPYDNATQWGRATPTRTGGRLGELAPALVSGRWCVLEPVGRAHPIDVGGQLADNARAIVEADAQGRYQQFITQYTSMGVTHLSHLALQTWLASRNRGLYGRWLANLPSFAVPDAARDAYLTTVPAAWQRASESAYLTLRRVSAGRAAPAGALESLRAAARAEIAVARAFLAPGSDGAGLTGTENHTPC